MDELSPWGIASGAKKTVKGKVVYAGECQFAVETDNRLRIYAKSSSGCLYGENYVKVNGFLVPAPAEEFTEGVVYIPDPGHVEFHYVCLDRPYHHSGGQVATRTRPIYRSAANAIAHAKAMLGLTPYARESLDDAWDEEPAPRSRGRLARDGVDAARPTPPEGSSP